MNKTFLIMKRLSLIALVVTLVFPMAACSKKKKELVSSDYGYVACDGTMGQFDVYVIRSKTDPQLFELSIIPYQLDAAGDIASITIANSNRAYKQLVNQVVLNPEQEISVPGVTEND